MRYVKEPGKPAQAIPLTPDEQAALDARAAAADLEDQERELREGGRAYADGRKAEYLVDLVVNKGDSTEDVIGHQIGQVIDAIQIIKRELVALGRTNVDLGPLEGSIQKIEAIRARHPKSVSPQPARRRRG